MHYCISKDIRIRICDSQAFFINIRTNELFTMNTNLYMYLKNRLNSEFTEDNSDRKEEKIKNFINELLKIGVLEKDDN